MPETEVETELAAVVKTKPAAASRADDRKGRKAIAKIKAAAAKAKAKKADAKSKGSAKDKGKTISVRPIAAVGKGKKPTGR